MLTSKDNRHFAIAAYMPKRPRGAAAETALASSQGSRTHSPEDDQDARVPEAYFAAEHERLRKRQVAERAKAAAGGSPLENVVGGLALWNREAIRQRAKEAAKEAEASAARKRRDMEEARHAAAKKQRVEAGPLRHRGARQGGMSASRAPACSRR